MNPDSAVDIMLWVAYILTGLAIVGAIVGPLISSLSDPKSLLKSGLGIGALVVVFLISYSLSGNEVTPLYEKFNVDAGLSQTLGGVLTMVYLLLGIAFVSIIVTEVSKIVK